MQEKLLGESDISFEKGKAVIGGIREHSKASEKYVDVTFIFPDKSKWIGAVPIVYRRTGTFAQTDDDVRKLIKQAYEAMKPEKKDSWLREQDLFWKTKERSDVTKPFFDALKDSTWKCVNCELPKNPNWARRIQDIKEMGYTIATHLSMSCKKCGRNTTHLILLRLARGQQTGYETWSLTLRMRILRVLNNYDSYENVIQGHLLPDHKFPEVRWDKDTREKNLDDMSNEEIRKKFQLLNNQRNQQKREVCRNCFQTGRRGQPFGIKFFYEGNENWGAKIPKTGKGAEKGCIGCGWYDLEKWRDSLNKKLMQVK